MVPLPACLPVVVVVVVAPFPPKKRITIKSILLNVARMYTQVEWCYDRIASESCKWYVGCLPLFFFHRLLNNSTHRIRPEFTTISTNYIHTMGLGVWAGGNFFLFLLLLLCISLCCHTFPNIYNSNSNKNEFQSTFAL